MELRDSITVALASRRNISAEALRSLYDSEPWWPERSAEDLDFMLQNNPAAGAWCGTQLVGFARAVTDSRFRAYIEDVLVLSEYRNAGVGDRLMHVLLEELQDIHVVTLFCQPRVSGFYKRFGFKEFTKQIVMQLRIRR